MKAFIVQSSPSGNSWNPIGEVSRIQHGLSITLTALPTQREVVVYGKSEADLLMVQGLPQSMKVLAPDQWVNARGEVKTKWTELGRAWKQTSGCKIMLKAIPTGKRLVLVPVHVQLENPEVEEAIGTTAQPEPAAPQVESAPTQDTAERTEAEVSPAKPRRRKKATAVHGAEPAGAPEAAPKQRATRNKKVQDS